MITKEFLTTLYPFFLKKFDIYAGDIIKVCYKIFEGDKERTQTYEGTVIAKKNNNIILRRKVLGVGVEQIFPLGSPKILSIIKKDKLKTRRSKLYFLRKKI